MSTDEIDYNLEPEDSNETLDKFNPDNFLGNSLLSSVLSQQERTELFEKVRYHIYCESSRRRYRMGFKEGLASFFMDPNNRDQLEVLRRRDSKRTLVGCSCDPETDCRVQEPELKSAFRDHWYFMGLETNGPVSKYTAVIDFSQHFINRWAQLFRIVYDVSLCPRGKNCEVAERRVDGLLRDIDHLSVRNYFLEVHGLDVFASD